MAVPVVVWILLQRLPYHRVLLAVGGNDAAAFSSGVDVTRVRILAYTLGGVFAAVAGIAIATLLQSSDGNAGLEYVLIALAAVALGGTPIGGGRGGLLGAIVGRVGDLPRPEPPERAPRRRVLAPGRLRRDAHRRIRDRSAAHGASTGGSGMSVGTRRDGEARTRDRRVGAPAARPTTRSRRSSRSSSSSRTAPRRSTASRRAGASTRCSCSRRCSASRPPARRCAS